MSRRILVLNERDLHNPRAGGAEVHCFEIFSRLIASRGDRVTLLASHFRGAAREDTIEGIRVVRVADPVGYYARVPFVYRSLRREAPFDVVVEDLNKFPFFARLWVRDPLVVFAHHLFGRTAFRQAAFPIATATYVAERLVPRIYRGLPVILYSPSTRDELVRAGLPPHELHLVPIGLDHARYHPAPEPLAPVPTVLALGRVEPSKRIELLVDAIVRLPGVRLVVAGHGTGMTAVREHVQARGMTDRVELRGFVDEDEKVRLLRTSHVIASASEKEGWGLTVIEAGACGTPSVATDAPGLRDAVRDGETGLLVREPAAAALAEALGSVLGDPALRARLGAAALRLAASFDWDRTAAQISAILDTTIGATR